ncbi:MAG: Fic family protein [Alphaproteobacteria bacterium]|nr:Fic family protein [Alphaproteobacteria bacterium]
MIGLKNIIISPTLLKNLSSIDEFKGLWRGLDQHTTGLQLLGDVADYGAHFKQVLGPLEAEDISPAMVRALHASLHKQKGKSDFRAQDIEIDFKDGDVLIGRLSAAPPEQIPAFLDKLCGWVNKALAEKEHHPLITAGVFTAVFLQVAPFETGNQGLARFLLLLILLKSGYTYAPYVSLEPLMEQRAEALYQALKANQESLEGARPDWGGWLEAFTDVLAAQCAVLYERLYAKEADLSNLPALSARIMALFKEHKRLQMSELVKLTRGRRATLKIRLNELIEAGYLHRHGQARSTWYSLV